MSYDLVVIGGGPAGMAAAVTAKKQGLERVLLVDRQPALGGILPQCIHDGFGKARVTGPEYAWDWQRQVKQAGVFCLLETTVLSVERQGKLYAVRLTGAKTGLTSIFTPSVVFATGCRERTLGQLRIPGTRPAGIFPAGAAQAMLNQQNLLPGKSAVILGLGNIGLILARWLTWEGARVKLMVGAAPSGLMRHYVQCVRDWNIPLLQGYTVCATHGYKRLKGVSVAPLDETGAPVLAQKRYIPCDTLLVAAGLIPEQTLFAGSGAALLEEGSAGELAGGTGLFACGNAVRVYDTVEQVKAWGVRAGRLAARFVLGQTDRLPPVPRFPPERQASAEALECLLQKKDVICILCPRGCQLRKTADGIWQGGGCRRGEGFAAQEERCPRRICTTTVRLLKGALPLLPVKTSLPVPKEQLPAVLKACRTLRVTAPVACGSVLASRIGGTEADLIATGDGRRKEDTE